MTINLGSIVNLKYELECKFKQRVYEQTSQAEEKAKILTSLAFAELSTFFDKMHQFTLESELGELDSDRSTIKSFVSNQFALAAIKCSEVMSSIQAKQQAKLNEYFSKKDEIEGKIADLKSKITLRETTLSGLETRITNIETTVNTNDTTRINQLDNEIKSVQSDLEKTHTESVEDLMKQKEVSKDIKFAAAEVVSEETTKVSDVVKETNKQGTQPVDAETKQLVFEFAKESKKALQETSKTANIDDEKMNEIKIKDEDKVNPAQLEFDFGEKVTTTEKPAEVAVEPLDPKPATTKQPLIVANEDIKETNDKSKVAVNQLAKDAGIDANQVNLAVQADAAKPAIVKTAVTVVETVVDAVTLATALVPQTQEEIGKKNIEESVEKVKTVNEATSELTENVDKKIANVQNDLTMVHTQLADNKDDINKTDTTAQGVNNIAENLNVITNETPETKKEKIIEHSKNLKEVAQKQKEIIQVQKDTIASLEKSAQTLITTGSLDNLAGQDEATKLEQEKEMKKMKEMLQDSFSKLDELMKTIAEGVKNKNEFSSNIDNSLLSEMDDLKNQSEIKSLEISNLKKETVKKDDKINDKNSEVFFISSEMKSIDKIIENCKEIAENSNKIVVDKELTGLYEKLTNILGGDKVVLDRREGDRRSKENGNKHDAQTVFGATQSEIKDLEELQANNKRNSSDRRNFDTSTALGDDDFDFFLKLNTNKDKKR